MYMYGIAKCKANGFPSKKPSFSVSGICFPFQEFVISISGGF